MIPVRVEFIEAINAFSRAPQIAMSLGDSKETLRAHRATANAAWAIKVWRAFRCGIGEDTWSNPLPRSEFMQQVALFVSAISSRFSLMNTLCFYAHSYDEGYATIWAARFAKILFDQNFRKDYELTAFAMRFVQAIKIARRFSVDMAKDEALRAEWCKLARLFSEWLNGAVKEMVGAAARNRWSRYARHYDVVLNDKESDLADAFARYRNEYYHGTHHDNEELLVAYAWILHDGMSLATRKFKNEKLVKLFKSEIAALPADRLPKDKPGSIGALLSADLKSADAFENGTLEARLYLKQHDVAKAIASYENVYVRDSSNIEVLTELLHQYVRIARYGGRVVSSKVKNPLVGDAFEKAKKIAEPVLDGTVKFAGKEALVRQRLLISMAEYLILKSRRARGLPYETARRYLNIFGSDIDMPFDATAYVVREGKDGRRFPASIEIVCEALATCGLTCKYYGADQLVRSTPKIINFIQNAQNCFCDAPKRRRELGRLMAASGTFEKEARSILMELLTEDFESAVAWVDLAEAYPHGSPESAECAGRALVLDKENGAASVRAHEVLARYFTMQDKHDLGMEELRRSDAIRAKKNWRLRHARELASSRNLQGTDTVIDNAAQYSLLSERADTIIDLPMTVCRGNVISSRNDAEEIRIALEPGKVGDNTVVKVKRSALALSTVHIGLPVSVKLTKAATQQRVVQVMPRDGIDWDVYPRSIGVVTSVDDNRGFVRFATNEGTLSVNRETCPLLADARLGMVCGLCVLPGAKGARVAIVEDAQLPDGLLPFMRRVRGALIMRKGRRFGYVEDVFVPPSICASVDGDEVTVLAVRIPVFGKQRDGWQAVAIEKELK